MCQIPLVRIKDSITVSYFVKCFLLVKIKELVFTFNLELQTMVISLAFAKTLDISGEKKVKFGEIIMLMFSGSKATGQSRMDALGCYPGHSKCWSGPWLTSQVWDVIWLI